MEETRKIKKVRKSVNHPVKREILKTIFEQQMINKNELFNLVDYSEKEIAKHLQKLQKYDIISEDNYSGGLTFNQREYSFLMNFIKQI
jgi:predicted transcriptional regulator